VLGRKSAHLLDHLQHPLIVLRPPDPGRLRGRAKVQLRSRNRGHLLPYLLHPFRRRPELLPDRQRDPGLQLHLSQGQLLLIRLQLLDQLHLGQDPAILPQHPQGVQLLGQGQPSPLPGEILNGELPGHLPDDLQFPRRQGRDAPEFLLQLLGGQDLNPPFPVQASGLDGPPVQSLDRRPLGLTWGQGCHPTPKLDLQSVLPDRSQHRIRHLFPATTHLREPHHVPSVVPCAPSSVRHLGREEGHCVGVEMDLTPSVLRMEVGQRKRPSRVPFPLASTHPNADRFPFHLAEVSGHHFPQNLPSDLRVILQALAQLGRQGDQRLLGLTEQAAPLGELVALQVVPHGQLAEQFRGREFLLGWIPAHLSPEIGVDDHGLHLAVPT